MEADPQPPLLVENIADVQATGGGDAGEREHHHADQSPVAQPHHCVGLDGAQQLAGLFGRQDGGLALAELLARGLYGKRRVVLEHAASDQVVEEHADGRHVLLQGGGRQAIGLGGFKIVASHIEIESSESHRGVATSITSRQRQR